MRNLHKLLWVSIFCMFFLNMSFAQSPAERVVTFRFHSGQDMFYIPYGGNDTELNRLYNLVDEYRVEITAGRMPVYVDGYCASLNDRADNLKIAAVRSNRVKSELITNRQLLEQHFITKNHATAYEGHKDMVVVTLRISAKAEEPKSDAAEQDRLAREREAAEQARREQQQREQAERERAERERAERERTEAEARQTQTQPIIEQPAVPSKSYCFAVGTNLLYDAFLLPTLGVEWRVNQNIGIRVDGSLSHWGDEKGKVQKIWLVNPEVRWYLGDAKRFYVGASGNFGEYNVYDYLIGDVLSDDTGYQGKLWNAGLTVGYQLPLSRSLSLDFNLGLGYTNLEYDSFHIVDKVRIYKEKDKSKDFWGPTQADISLIWTIGGNK